MRTRFLLIVSCIVLPLLAISGCGSSSSGNYAGTINEGRAAAREVMEATGASSISLAFIEGGRVAWAETFGVADKSTMAAPATDTMYCIGSTSKMVATIAVMK
ncbi:MAG: class A beta-lactamase-related serine hydrolase, partial [Deltaproteobacteria bacterium]|nr:class A beta-lactamase-related serine hydrolase [Deltaproteobacteria bacterium]